MKERLFKQIREEIDKGAMLNLNYNRIALAAKYYTLLEGTTHLSYNGNIIEFIESGSNKNYLMDMSKSTYINKPTPVLVMEKVMFEMGAFKEL